VTLVLLCLTVVGCGPKRYKVTVKLLKDNKPFAVAPEDQVALTFYPVDSGDSSGDKPSSYPATAIDKAQGTYEVKGNDQKGWPAGKYRISIQVISLPSYKPSKKLDEAGKPAGPPAGPVGVDKLRGRFGVNSPITRTVESDGEIIINLDKPTG